MAWLSKQEPAHRKKEFTSIKNITHFSDYCLLFPTFKWKRHTCGTGNAATRSMKKFLLMYLFAIFLGSVTSSPLPSTLELGSTYAVEKLIAIWAMKNMSRKDRRQMSIMARWWSIVIHNWRSLPSTVGRKKKRGSMKWEATHETRKTRFHISTALPPGSSILSSRLIQILEKSFNLSTILLLIVLTEPVAKLFCLSLASFSIRLSLQSKKSIKTYTI